MSATTTKKKEATVPLTIGQFTVKMKTDHPEWTHEEILGAVHKNYPGAKTTIASISSTLSRAGLATGRTSMSTGEFEDFSAKQVEETDEEAFERICLRYEAMERLGIRLVERKMPSLIVSGPPGMSKSWTITEALRGSGRLRHDGLTNVGGGGPMKVPVQRDGKPIYPNKNDEFDSDADGLDFMHTPGYYDHIGGTMTAVGLYHALWNMRKGGVLFLDDVDAVFRDEDALNLLKVSTDSTKERLCSWRKNSSWLDDYEIDKTFDFQGHLVFLTNLDFEDMMRKGSRDSEHYKALIDRALYLCLTLRTPRDFMLRIRDVADCIHPLTGKPRHKEGEHISGKCMLAKFHGMADPKRRKELLDFVEEFKGKWYNLSLRLVGQMATAMANDPEHWKKDIIATKMRTY